EYFTSTHVPLHEIVSGGAITTSGYFYPRPSQTTELPLYGPTGITHITSSPPHGVVPGEGSCLVDEVTYKNNSSIPPATPCQQSCRCVSSIIHCVLLNCPPPPPHHTNCMPVQSKEGACCPTYTCDEDSKKPLEVDNQMAEQTRTTEIPDDKGGVTDLTTVNVLTSSTQTSNIDRENIPNLGNKNEPLPVIPIHPTQEKEEGGVTQHGHVVTENPKEEGGVTQHEGHVITESPKEEGGVTQHEGHVVNESHKEEGGVTQHEGHVVTESPKEEGGITQHEDKVVTESPKKEGGVTQHEGHVVTESPKEEGGITQHEGHEVTESPKEEGGVTQHEGHVEHVVTERPKEEDGVTQYEG
ncbi:unnamed protein product, partial [Timema podura]|nr:unnamed protein product [Timema podura]